jgi:carboxyl-terminal processing protease
MLSMRRAAVILSAALLEACAAPRATPVRAVGTASDTISRAERLRIVDAMAEHVRSHFAHFSALGAQSFDSMVTAFRASVERDTGRWAFDSAALAFTAGLRNGHTRFSDQWLTKARGQTLWLQLRPDSGSWIVTMSEIDALRVGDGIRAIDDVPIERFYAARRALIPESGERSRRAALVFADYLFPQQFVVTTDDGRQIRVTRGDPTDSTVMARRSRAPLLPHGWIVHDSIAYIRVRRFSPRSHEDSALAVLTRAYATAPALIVDVRGNGGGSTPRRLIAALRAGEARSSLRIERSTFQSDRFRWLASLRPSRTALSYRGVVTILTDGGCGSACEDFVARFVFADHARIIGDTTWGSSGQPRVLSLGHGMTFQVSARRYAHVDGTPFEGAGIAPHEVVRPSASDLRSGRDPVLERAISSSRERLRR